MIKLKLLLKLSIILFIIFTVTSCSSIQGYPHDPEDEDAVLTELQKYFSPHMDERYYASTDENSRRQIRDEIVLNRIRAFDIEFDIFSQSLYGERNKLSVGSDLLVLALNGAGATTGDAATKAALAAASAGIVGAQGSINKDFFYDRTVPALIAQLQASRIKLKSVILQNIARSDNDYPLPRAYLDLEALKNAGGLSNAISAITQQASVNKEIAQNQLDRLRNVYFVSGTTSQMITKWLFGSSNQVNVARRTILEAWIQKNVGDVPFQTLISASTLESSRAKAIAELQI